MLAVAARSWLQSTARWLSRHLVRKPTSFLVARLLLCIAIYCIEIAPFWSASRDCRNRLPGEAKSAPIQLLLLADPQIITGGLHPSYPGRVSRALFPLLRLFTDRFAARSWRALRYPGGGVKGWTAKLWLGDLTDTGRSYYHLEGARALFKRFFRLFPDKVFPHNRWGQAWNRAYYIPGNHDVSILPPSTWHAESSAQAYWREQVRDFMRWKFLQHFGTDVWDMGWDGSAISPPTQGKDGAGEEDSKAKYHTKVDHTSRKSFNARIPIEVPQQNGTEAVRAAELILLDATDIVSLQRMGRSPWVEQEMGRPGAEADWRFGGSWWFIDALSKDRDPAVPRILVTHIPLHRNPSATRDACTIPNRATFPPNIEPVPHPDLIREHSSSIHDGSDLAGTYENLINKEWSKFIKEKIQPNVIFSGDDHDLCHHLHDPSLITSGDGLTSTWTIPELTLHAMSITSGVRTPGFARLAIWQNEGPRFDPSVQPIPQTHIAYTPCTLPRQIETWALSYPILVIAALFFVFVRLLYLGKNSYGDGSHSSGCIGARRGSRTASMYARVFGDSQEHLNAEDHLAAADDFELHESEGDALRSPRIPSEAEPRERGNHDGVETSAVVFDQEDSQMEDTSADEDDDDFLWGDSTLDVDEMNEKERSASYGSSIKNEPIGPASAFGSGASSYNHDYDSDAANAAAAALPVTAGKSLAAQWRRPSRSQPTPSPRLLQNDEYWSHPIAPRRAAKQNRRPPLSRGVSHLCALLPSGPPESHSKSTSSYLYQLFTLPIAYMQLAIATTQRRTRTRSSPSSFSSSSSFSSFRPNHSSLDDPDTGSSAGFTLSQRLIRDFWTVAWVPILYWLGLWVLGY